MRRAMAAFASAAVLAMLIPGAVAADRLTRYHDHTVDVYCEGPVDGGYAYARFFSSELDGSATAEVGIWQDPALPFEDPADVSGSSASFDVVEGDVLTASADIAVAGPGGSDLGTGTLSAELTANGPAQPFADLSFGNHKSRTAGTSQEFGGSATFTLGVTTTEIPGCGGIVTDIDAWATNPRSFVSSDAGLDMSCHWDTPDGAVDLFVQALTTGLFSDVYLQSPDGSLASLGFSGTADTTAVDLTFDLVDPDTGVPSDTTATATATFTAVGSPVDSTLRTQSSLTKLRQQLLAPAGSLTYEPGETFTMDSSSCRAVSFSRKSSSTQPAGPRTAPAPPVNDTPDGAIALAPGDKLVTTNRGAAIDPEQPITTCPEGPFDDLGRTLWYAVQGTGGPVTVDTAGSLIDTVAAAFVADGDALVEIACNDDTEVTPLKQSYQAAITFDTVEGVTYLVEVGGYRRFFDPETVETGQIRVAVR